MSSLAVISSDPSFKKDGASLVLKGFLYPIKRETSPVLKGFLYPIKRGASPVLKGFLYPIKRGASPVQKGFLYPIKSRTYRRSCSLKVFNSDN